MIFSQPTDTLHLAADLRKDKAILAEEHGYYVGQPSKYHFEIFEKYAKLNLTNCKYSRKKVGKHVINSWKNVSAHLTIFQVQSVIEVDTIFEFESLNVNSVHKAPNEKYHIKATFYYRSYIIDDGKKPQLVYMSELKSGLLQYSVGNKVTFPIYEDIPIGQQYPNLKEILKVIGMYRE
ncbi:hypothetical protein HH214_06720 [Mucilaginibacter robiniae]|uniref:Uncharacterized protein n=2 Tax=Mucilaginibacter robiniae TaxID=2728022 RepID=A0A7L5DZD8_9SPHI|nr:hypothetical protein HH214_06720 [Mucilaginibacter robiniae]